MAANYKDNFDYSAAIAKTQDAAEREQLLAERQNKIDAEGLEGKVPSNEAVSTWTYTYRPYSVPSGSAGGSSSSSSGSLSIGSLYDAIAQAQMKRFEAAREQIDAQLSQNLASIDEDYTASRTRTDVNARLSALRNEEKLAALGLNMANASSAATSGAAESSRIAMDNQYRSDLNELDRTRLSARAAAQNYATQQKAALESDYYSAVSDAALQQAQATLSQFNADRDYSLSVAGLTGYLNGSPTLSYRQYQTDLLSDSQSQAYEQALNRWKTYGYVLQSDASVLGVPAGTPTSDTSYQNASLALQRWKAGYYSY